MRAPRKKPPTFEKVSECLYRFADTGNFCARVWIVGKEMRRSLKTSDTIRCFLCGLALVLLIPQPLSAQDIRLGTLPANRILFIGNSITFTKHDPNGPWPNDCGMAASAPGKDYTHLVTACIAQANGGRAPEMRAENFWYAGGQYEQRYAGFDPAVTLKPLISWKPDIVVIAIGENVENLDTPAKESAFAASFEAMIEAFQQNNAAVFVRGRFMGRNAVHDRVMRRCCVQTGAMFVGMDTPALGRDPLNYAAAEKDSTGFTDSAILAHPGDRGMKAIADALFAAMKVHAGVEPAPVIQPALLGDKTLVAWVSPANLSQQGSGVISLASGEAFDALVLGEKQPGKWMAGSDHFRRTQADQTTSAAETALPGEFIQLAVVYAGNRITLYRNGSNYADYDAGTREVFDSDCDILMGIRYREPGGDGPTGFFAGDIDELRIYDRPLDAAAIQSLKPGQPGQPAPFCMWTFDELQVVDRMGRYPTGTLVNNATISDGRLHLAGGQYAVISHTQPAPIAPKDHPVQAGFYAPQRKGHMWDTWACYDGGRYYLFYLMGAGGDAHELAISEDGVHWKEYGAVVYPRADIKWMGSGRIWKSPDFEKTGKWIMNYSEWVDDHQDIMFVTSTDLLNWTKVDEKHRFKPDTRWYQEKGHWDCIETVQRPDGSFYGYFTAHPDPAKVPDAHCGFGFGESRDGIFWTALPPLKGDIGGEVAGVQKIGDNYYILIGWGRVAIADKPEGPFRVPKKNPNLFGLVEGETDDCFPCFVKYSPDGPLVSHHYLRGTVYSGPLKAAEVDREGVLRLKWWKGNEKLKAAPLEARLAEAGPGYASSLRMLDARLDGEHAYVIEGRLQLPDAGASDHSIFFDSGGGQGQVLILERDRVRFAEIKADGTDLRSTCTFSRDMDFGPSFQFRIVMKADMMEAYLNDYLMVTKRVKCAGRLGLLAPDVARAFTDLHLWRSN